MSWGCGEPQPPRFVLPSLRKTAAPLRALGLLNEAIGRS
jgi:hypothetical protein